MQITLQRSCDLSKERDYCGTSRQQNYSKLKTKKQMMSEFGSANDGGFRNQKMKQSSGRLHHVQIKLRQHDGLLMISIDRMTGGIDNGVGEHIC